MKRNNGYILKFFFVELDLSDDNLNDDDDDDDGIDGDDDLWANLSFEEETKKWSNRSEEKNGRSGITHTQTHDLMDTIIPGY